jgi:hypothetical protein
LILSKFSSRMEASRVEAVEAATETESRERKASAVKDPTVQGRRVKMNDVGGQLEGKSEHVASCGGNMYIRER